MKALTAMLLSLVLVACQTAGTGPAITPEEAVSTRDEIYKIGEGDSLSISVWRNPELSVNVPVRPDGMISVPLVGDVKAAGEEPEALGEIIKNELANYIKNPQVTVVVTNAVSFQYVRRVRVTGAVSQPTSISFSEGMTIMDLVLFCGGVTEFAKANDTKLYRLTSSGTKVYIVKLQDILEKGDITTNYALQPGDIITIPERLF